VNDPATSQHPAERWLAWLAAACWLASWLLPVVDDYPGWAAFRAALTGPFRDPMPVGAEESIPQVLSAFTNVIFAGLFLTWLGGRIKLPALFLKVAIACLILNLYWLVMMYRAGGIGDLLAGYYVWLAAFVLLVAVGTISVVSARRTSRTPTAGTPA
jgi:glucan phosphoethanolaminetransferase (alkaline phosphatase superfamily)